MRGIIQFKDGRTIEVTPTVKRMAGIHARLEVGKYIFGSEADTDGSSLANKYKKTERKYSVEMLNFANERADVIGITKASKESGIHVKTLKAWRTKKNRENNTLGNRHRPSTYTMEQKIALVAMAKKLMLSDEKVEFRDKRLRIFRKRKWKMLPAFIHAGLSLGMNGRSILHQYTIGMIPEPNTPPPQPLPPEY